jgi:hypothetical protein
MPRKRETIHGSHVMPEILEMLKREKRMKKKAIIEKIAPVAAAKGLRYRDFAVSYALTVLRWKNWVSNDVRGVWSITTEGSECPNLTETRAREILREKEAADTGFETFLVEVLENELEKAAGFESNPQIRRVIEDHAMKLAKRDYFERGYSFEDKHAKESYDLLCKKDGVQILVEVKGTRSDGSAIILTHNEVELATDPNYRTELCVVHSISVSGEKASAGTLQRYENWNPAAHDLRPIGYQCRLLKKLATTA